MKNFPIFIITCDRITSLSDVLSSYYKLDNVGDIIIHDNGSTFQPMICYLRRLAHVPGIRVYFNPSIKSKDELNSVSLTIQHYFMTHEPSNYVVTDCDIEITAPEDILNIYSMILDGISDCAVVAPMLNIFDIPDFYPKKKQVISTHMMRFWNKKKMLLEVNGKTIQYIDAFVDTTFGMYRKGSIFKRHQLGIRTHHPYTARHLDWYLDPNNLTEDQVYYSRKCSKDINHWRV